MNKSNNSFELLEMMDRPGFFVQDGKIVYANIAARQLMIDIDTDISRLLLTGKQEYADYIGGNLYLTLQVSNTVYRASVSRVDNLDLFLIEHAPEQSELQALALAAAHLRSPLSEVMNAAEELAEGSDCPQMQQINHGLFRLLRIVGNMSDAAQMPGMKSYLSTQDICAVFYEILENAQALLSSKNIRLDITVPDKSIYMLADKEALERAVYNLISNAVKFSPRGSALQARVERSGYLLYFTVSATSESPLPANIFTRYLRQPSLEDNRTGLGLGMVLVHSTASAHGGTVLVEQTAERKIRVTMTMEIRNGESVVRSNLLRPDVYGGRNQALVELSDVLSKELYNGKY